jgi:SAM-dependent methyltransferase
MMAKNRTPAIGKVHDMLKPLQSLLTRLQSPSAESAPATPVSAVAHPADVAPPLPDPTVDIRPNFPDAYNADLQLAAAKHLRWLIDSVETNNDELVIRGWCLSFAQDQADVRFLLNGRPFAFVEWPIPSEGLVEFYGFIPGATQARFICRQPITNPKEIFPDGYARFSAVNRLGEHPRSYRTNWYYSDPHSPLPLPGDARMARVVFTGDPHQFILGGATIARRFDMLLRERFDRPLISFARILDWGCGSGRVTRHLIQMGCPAITGADIDPDNIQWCRENLPGADFQHLQLNPPTPFADAQFDLVIGISVMTHLAEADQFRWLAELQRLTKPGGILLLSIRGLVQLSLYKEPSERYVVLERQGFLDSGVNIQLEGVIEDQTFYRDVDHSRDYIFARWSKYFDVLDIVDAIASNQDIVILRRR